VNWTASQTGTFPDKQEPSRLKRRFTAARTDRVKTEHFISVELLVERVAASTLTRGQQATSERRCQFNFWSFREAAMPVVSIVPLARRVQ